MKVTIFVLALTAAAAANADCTYPKAPESAPNGSTATEAEMVAGMESLKKYNAAMTAYLACLDSEAEKRIQEAGSDQERIKQIKAVTDKRHNAAVEEMSTRAGDFNSQLKAFKQKQKG